VITHCTVVTSAPRSFSIAGRATESAVKSLPITKTAMAMAAMPRICALLNAGAPAPPLACASGEFLATLISRLSQVRLVFRCTP
jgi:hypothetical protein